MQAEPKKSLVGEEYEVEVGPVAHGGHCIARTDEGQVLFVRHTLPGERVLARVTEGEEGARFLRADAVEVLTASKDRVEAPCPQATSNILPLLFGSRASSVSTSASLASRCEEAPVAQ